ncbi:MAG: hypothetical protein WDZ31_10290 [Phycisphaeraceae bacterium]
MRQRPSICLVSMLALSMLAAVPAFAQSGDSPLRTERVRATERLNPARTTMQASAHERAVRSVQADQDRAAAAVQALRNAGRSTPAYEYQVNGERRVSVAQPRRIHHEPARVQHHRRHVDEVERSTARLAASYGHGSVVIHDREPALHDAVSHPDPRHRLASATPRVFVNPTVHDHHPPVGVTQVIHRQHRHSYAGYHHKPDFPRSAHIISRHHHRSHPAFHNRPTVRIEHYFDHHRPAPRWHRTSRHHRFSTSYYCPPPVRHHRHGFHSKSSISFHIRF